MKVTIGCLLLTFLTGFRSNLYAQMTSAAIRGKIITESRAPAELSTVILLNIKDSAIINSVTIGKNGFFQFTTIKPGDYRLLITKIGYDKLYAGPFHVTENQTTVVNDLILKSSSQQLNEVSISGSRPDVEVKPGRVILNIGNSLMAAGNSVFDILRQSPGVRVDNNNNINISGRQSALITIDGKAIGLTGDDLAGILRGMQSSMIDRIELITAGNAKYDAAGGGIINIVLKKGKNIGSNVTVTGTAGYGKYYKSNAGIVFNDRTAKINIFGTYNFSDDKTFRNIITDRLINYNNLLSDYYTNYNNTEKSYNNTFSLGTDYLLYPNQTIGFLVNGTVRTDDFVKDNNLKISDQHVLDSVITANSNLDRHYSRVNYNVNYSGKIDKSGKTLTADLDYTNYSRTSNEYITNIFLNSAGNTYRDPLLLQNLSPSAIHIWLSKIDFTDPLSKTSKLEAGIKYSNATSNNDLIFGPKVNGMYQSDPAFSNHFVYTENINAAYLNYEGKFNRFDLTAGLRAEQTKAEGNSITSGRVVNNHYLDLLPQLLLTFNQNKSSEFSLIYSRGVTRPGYEAINPFLYYIDLYDYRSGNPNLKPEYTNTVELAYSYDQTYTTTLYSTIISNAYEFPFYEQNDTSKVNVTTTKNLGTIYNYGIRFIAPVAFTGWWNADFSFDGSYQRYISYPENGTLNKGTQDIILSTTQHFIINKTVSAEINGFYESPNFYGINQFKANYYVNAGIGKQLFNKRGSIKINATDIFNTRRDRSHTSYENLDLTTVDKRETQAVRLTFTYRLGKTLVKSASNHNTGAKDEQRRIGSGGDN